MIPKPIPPYRYLLILLSLICVSFGRTNAQSSASALGSDVGTTLKPTISVKPKCCPANQYASNCLNIYSPCGYCHEPKIYKFNLKIKVSAVNSNGIYEYGKNQWQANFKIVSKLVKLTTPGCMRTEGQLDTDPFDGMQDNTINFNLNEKNTEAVFLLTIDKSTKTYGIVYNVMDELNLGSTDYSPNFLEFDLLPLGMGNGINGIDPKDIKIEFSREDIEADYPFVFGSAFSNNCPKISKPNSNSNPTLFNWSPKTCPLPLYQFQIMRLYNVQANSNPQNISVLKEEVNWNNALNLYVKEQFLNLTLAEGKGYYAWRVRGIKTLYPGGEANPNNWTEWLESSTLSTATGPTITINSSTVSSDPFIFFYNQFDNDKNWIYNRNLIESEEIGSTGLYANLIGEGMTYANGLGMSRQNQSKNNVYDQIVVNSSFQDYLGRNAIATLPAAIAQNNLQYANGLNLGFNPTQFDEDNNFNTSSTVIQGAISDYYSDANPDVDVPSCNDGYSFTRTVFNRNPLSEVLETSMPGAAHAMGNGHTSQSISTSVADIELIRIFGDEAPDEKSVIKKINIDPNKTISVSYIDKTGKTIATCLSSPPSSHLQPIPAPPPFTVVHTLNANAEFKDYILASKKLDFQQPVTLNFAYELEIKKYENLCTQVCATCDFEIELALQKLDDLDAPPVWISTIIIPSANCSTVTGNRTQYLAPTTFDITASNLGSYILTKKIKFTTLNPATNKTYFQEAKEELLTKLNDKLLQATNPSTTNWKVLDANGNIIGSGTPNINLELLKQKLLDKEMEGPTGVFAMLNIDESSTDMVTRKLILVDSFCSESIILTMQPCGKIKCNDQAAFAQSLMQYLNDQINNACNATTNPITCPSNYFRLNNMLFNIHPNPSSVPVSYGGNNQTYILYTEAEVKDILLRMLNDPELSSFYSCDQLNNAWIAATDQYLTQLTNNQYPPANATQPPASFTEPDLLDLFFTAAGYHFTCGTDIIGNSNTIGYKTHPYRCFYHPNSAALHAALQPILIPTPTSAASVPSYIASCTNYNSILISEAGSPCIGVILDANDFMNYQSAVLANNFNPNHNNMQYPIPSLTYCVTEKDLLSFHNSIQYASDANQAASILPFPTSPSLDVNQTLEFISNQEEECKRICDARLSEFRETVSKAFIDQNIQGNPTLVEGTNYAYDALSYYGTNVFTLNWLDVHTAMVLENCKDKCNLKPQKVIIGNDTNIVIDPTRTKNFLKPFGFDMILQKSNSGNNNINPGSSVTNLCQTCQDQNFQPWPLGCSISFNQVHNATTAALTANPGYPRPQIHSKLTVSCCGNQPDELAYPVENVDPDYSPSWSHVAQLNSSRVYSSIQLMIPWLEQRMSAYKLSNLGGNASTKVWNLYDDVINYLNPISYHGGGVQFSTFLADDNTNTKLELKSDAGVASTKNVTLDYNKAFFHAGGLLTTSETISGFVIERTQSKVLPMHVTMHVKVKIKPAPSSSITFPITVHILEELKDYGIGASSTPQLQFVSGKSILSATKKFYSANDILEFEYDARINDDVNNRNWAISNGTLKYAHDATHPTSPLLTGTPEANVEYAKTTFTIGSANTIKKYNIDIPLLRTYVPNQNIFPLANSISPLSAPDISIPLIFNGTTYQFSGSSPQYDGNVQVVPFYYYHYDTNGVLIETKLWDLNNYKVHWNNYFCVQWKPKTPIDIEEMHQVTCAEMVASDAYNALTDGINTILNKHVQLFSKEYVEHCTKAKGLNDLFTASYELNYHHYTLYYYDRASNLVRTVAPKDVDLNATNRNMHPNHLFTTYNYNSLNQLTKQTQLDHGTALNPNNESVFWYDIVGRIRFSQNPKQKLNNVYSYSKYDLLGRIIEVGESAQNAATFGMEVNNPLFPTSKNHDIVWTTYTTPYYVSSSAVLKQCVAGIQSNTLNRVSYSISDEDGISNTIQDQVITVYSYDQHGNVRWMANKVADMPFVFVRYEYDIISGSVKKVAYNECDYDGFFHRYTYNTNKQLVKAETSRDNKQWDTDAEYTYFKHGPLKNAMIGQDDLQRINYGYTIQGWLKGMNHWSRTSTIGNFKHDDLEHLYAMKIRYFEGDFERSYSSTASAFNTDDAYGLAVQPGVPLTEPTYNLFNGNIPEIITSVKRPIPISGNSTNLFANRYEYDELNRIKESHYLTNTASNTIAESGQHEYDETWSYDANGNILTAERRGIVNGNVIPVDNFTYHYTSGKNQLKEVSDAIGASVVAGYDIGNQAANNYAYDEIGNLAKDIQENISNIAWTPYGKIRYITKTDNSKITFLYDAFGNRVMKSLVANTTLNSLPYKQEYYARDASGNTMSTYKRDNNLSTNQYLLLCYDQPMYGSDRLGSHISGTQTYAGSMNMAGIMQLSAAPNFNAVFSSRKIAYRKMNNKRYELKDHLGNVHVTFSDYRLSDVAFNTATSYTLDYTKTNFRAEQMSMYNLYAFGMPKHGNEYVEMPNDVPQSMMAYQGNNAGYKYGYRFGFNGKEKLNEVMGDGNCQDYGMRIYNTRLARFLSADPLVSTYPWLTPYQFSSNDPIRNIDIDGLEGGSGIEYMFTAIGNDLESWWRAPQPNKPAPPIKRDLTKPQIDKITKDKLNSISAMSKKASSDFKISGVVMVVGGGLLSLTEIGAPIGIPMMAAGYTSYNVGSQLDVVSTIANINVHLINEKPELAIVEGLTQLGNLKVGTKIEATKLDDVTKLVSNILSDMFFNKLNEKVQGMLESNPNSSSNGLSSVPTYRVTPIVPIIDKNQPDPFQYCEPCKLTRPKKSLQVNR